MSNNFHLAINVKNLEESIEFYCHLLGCSLGAFEKGSWQDINFWGNELTLHKSDIKNAQEIHPVDMGNVPVPHFGIHLDNKTYKAIKNRIESSDKFRYFDEPYLRFKDSSREQETFFIKDPSNNMIEIKSMKNPEALFS